MRKKKLNIRVLMQIEDISDGKEKALKATLPEYKATVYGEDMNELMEGVKIFLEYWEEEGKYKFRKTVKARK